MKTLIRQRIGKDVGAVSEYMKMPKNESFVNKIGFISGDVYSIEFEFIFEDEKEKKDYWLKIWRLWKHVNFVNYCITNILNGEITVYQK